MVTNPNGANQWVLDPRQKLCWENYSSPKSETFGNATQSAIKAGYEAAYADDITSSDWFRAKLWRLNATYTGEKKIKQIMEEDYRDNLNKIDPGIMRIQADLAKYLTSTQGKDEGYSTRQDLDLTSKGEKINGLTPEEQAALNSLLLNDKQESSSVSNESSV